MRRFPGIPDALQSTAATAHDAGLHLAQYNSGAARNPLNGIRIFRGTSSVDFFRGDHITHCRTKAEAEAFIAGFVCGAR